MLYCKKCGVSVDGNPDFCPLCQGELSGVAENASKYPIIKKKNNGFSLSVKICVMLSITAVVICAVINYCLTRSLLGWWLYVLGAVLSFWLSFGAAVKRRGNIAKSIFFTTFVAVFIMCVWDFCTGRRGWSLDFVLPIASCAAMLSMAVIAKIQRLPIEQYIYYLILDIIFGVVPLILILCSVVKFLPLSLACVAASVLSLSALLIFEGKALKAEIIRRTHL